MLLIMALRKKLPTSTREDKLVPYQPAWSLTPVARYILHQAGTFWGTTHTRRRTNTTAPVLLKKKRNKETKRAMVTRLVMT